MILRNLLGKVIKDGRLRVIDADGAEFTVGRGEPEVTIRLSDKALERQLALNPYLKLGEAYMDGLMTVDPPHGIYDLLALLLSNIGLGHPTFLTRALAGVRYYKRGLDQFNPARRARRNVAHHYDLDGGLYDLFLDADKQYSCAYYPHEGMSLEEAQQAKKRHIAAKLDLKPGQRVLDIGCGWGGMALYLARAADVEVTGITLSENQLKVARDRAAEAGLSDRVKFELIDYRKVDGPFDRIVSVGMFEHVGAAYFGRYFRAVRRLLADDGVALIHTIGRQSPPGSTNPWIAKYIFPGGYIPALSETAASIEREGLCIGDVEVLRLHYALTLEEWRRRFMANRDKAVALYDERFCRMWEFYLAASECSFRYDGMVNFQIQLMKRNEALPLARDYMVDEERDLPLDPSAPKTVEAAPLRSAGE